MSRYKKSEVLRVYARHPLAEKAILKRVRASRGTLTGLTEFDLAVDDTTELTDQNHVGGITFVRELATRARIDSTSRVLDLGCGLGGPARALATIFGCRVHGIDFSPKRCQEAVRLTKLVGLTEPVSFECGDFRTANVRRGDFDVVWGQAAWTHISNKSKFFQRWSATLGSGGRIAMEDAFLRGAPTTVSGRALLRGLEKQWNAHLVSLEQWEAYVTAEGLKVRLGEDLTTRMETYSANLVKRWSRNAAFRAEVTTWQNAVKLVNLGLLGYCRIVAEKID